MSSKKAVKLFALLIYFLLGTQVKGEVKREFWGEAPSGETVSLYSLRNGKLRVELTEYGARIVSAETPDRRGRNADVVLGFKDLAGYVNAKKGYFGAVVGRYGNRIAKGEFSLAGRTYQVSVNAKGNALHGGTEGFDRKVWKGRIVNRTTVQFMLVSSDGDMGFPGELTVRVTYRLMTDRLRLEYEATTTRTTVLNLTNHSYFNLAGQGSGDILQQQLRIDAESYTPVDETLIPTGASALVAGTPLDFRKETAIGSRIDTADEQLQRAGGYDHNYVISGKAGELREAAYAVDTSSGRSLKVLTTEPGLQFYSGNNLDGSLKGYSGVAYRKYGGFCLEAQHFPDSPHHPNFPSTVLQPGETFHSVTEFVFGVEKN